MAIGGRRVIFARHRKPVRPADASDRALPEQTNVIRMWIDQGAPRPDEFSAEAPATSTEPNAARIMDALQNGDR